MPEIDDLLLTRHDFAVGEGDRLATLRAEVVAGFFALMVTVLFLFLIAGVIIDEID